MTNAHARCDHGRSIAVAEPIEVRRIGIVGASTPRLLPAIGGLQGAVVKDEEKDKVVWQEYLTNILKKRGADWRSLFSACAEHNS